MSKICIDKHTPYLAEDFKTLLKKGMSEKEAAIEIALNEHKSIFTQFNILKKALGLKENKSYTPPKVETPKKLTEDEKLLETLRNFTTDPLIKAENLQFFIDQAGSAPYEFVQKYGQELASQLIQKVPTDILQSHLDRFLDISAENPNVSILDKEISRREAKAEPEQDFSSPIEELQFQLSSLREILAKTSTPLVSKILKEKIIKIEDQINTISKPKEDMTPIEKLKATSIETTIEQVQQPTIISHVFEGSNFKIDFDNDTIEGYFDEITKDYVEDFFNSFMTSVFTKAKIENNGINYYFIKHNKSSKFVSFDDSLKFLKVNELPQEIQDSSKFKNIENCS